MCKRHHKSVPNCLRFETNAEERGLKTPRPSLLQSEVRLRQVPCWQAFSPVFWSLLVSYLFIDVISNLGKLLKLECDIKLALLLRWLVRRVFTRCSLCALPYIFSFRFREVNLQIAESIWCGSPRKWSWNGGVVSVESIFIRPGERLSSHLLEWLAKRGALVTTNIGCQLTSYIRCFAHAFTLLRPELLVSRERKGLGCWGGEYLQNISVIAFKKVVWLSELDNLHLKQKYLVFKFLTRTVKYYIPR